LNFVCGTENQIDESNNLNRIVFGSLSYQNNILKPNPKLSSFSIHEHIRDTVWMDEKRIILALNSKLAVLEVERLQVTKFNDFPQMHKNTIRQLAFNPENQLLISGGFDGLFSCVKISRECFRVEHASIGRKN
jgi:hypothetical protein